MKDRNAVLQRFKQALIKLEEALKQPENAELSVDGTIQRFEFCFELGWKAMQAFLQYEGFDVKSPRAALQKAYVDGWIIDEALWLQMLEDRNDTSHTYNEALAKEIYARIKTYAPALAGIAQILENKE